MTDFTYYLGYFAMAASALTACVLACALLADFAYRTLCRARGLLWIGRAMRHYAEIEPPPRRGAK